MNRLRQLKEVIGVSADLITLGAFVATAISIGIGFIAQSLEAALLAALGFAVLIGLALVNRIRTLTQEMRRLRRGNLRLIELAHASLTSIQLRLTDTSDTLGDANDALADDDSAADDEPPVRNRPSPWLPDRNDLTTFQVTAEQFEEASARAVQLARPELGPDVVARFQRMLLYGSDWPDTAEVPLMMFDVNSFDARKHVMVIFRGSLDVVQSSTGPTGRREKAREPFAPWRVDGSWNDLVHASWRRMRDFSGVVALVGMQPKLLGVKSAWLMHYEPSGKVPATELLLQDGRLMELEID